MGLPTVKPLQGGAVNEEPLGEAAPVLLRVASWNMNHWRQPTRPDDTRAQAWTFLRHELRPDVALLQETVPPASIGRSSFVYREIADYRPWGSAVVTRDGLALEEVWAVKTRFSRRRFQLANTFPGSVAVDGVAPITFVSVYNVGDTYHETKCSFETLIEEYQLGGDPALAVLARVVHGADVSKDADFTPQSRGLEAIARGFMDLGVSDQEQLALELPVYDALYAWAQRQVREG
jgi:hypothetical protein